MASENTAQRVVTKVIHVSPGTIKSNYDAIKAGKLDDVRPAIVVEVGGQKIHAYRIAIQGPCTILQNDEHISASGARVWIETEADLELETTRPFFKGPSE